MELRGFSSDKLRDMDLPDPSSELYQRDFAPPREDRTCSRWSFGAPCPTGKMTLAIEIQVSFAGNVCRFVNCGCHA